jgi:hypothetical protein
MFGLSKGKQLNPKERDMENVTTSKVKNGLYKVESNGTEIEIKKHYKCWKINFPDNHKINYYDTIAQCVAAAEVYFMQHC